MAFVLFIIVGVYDSHVILLSSYYRTPVDRDYNKMTEQDCSEAVTHYVGNKFGDLCDVTVTSNDKVIISDCDNKINVL